MSPAISPWAILIAAVVTNNILLSNFLGVCSFVACSAQIPTAVGLGAAVMFVVTTTVMLNYGLYYGILVADAPLCPADLTHLQYIMFIVVIAAFVQFVEMVVERFSQGLYHALGVFLPLITVNCAIFGAALFMVTRRYSFGQAAAFGLGAGGGWMLAIVLMAGLRRKMGYADVPEPLRGAAVTMIITGVMAMAFMGFAGMVRIQ